MKVRVKWIKSPRRKYGIDRKAGEFSMIDTSVAKKILAESPGIFEYPELDKPIKVKDTMARKTHTRPVKK
jgi:hypothetical protein